MGRRLISPHSWLWRRGDPDRFKKVPDFQDHELSDLVIKAVEALESPYREYIEMRYWQRLTYREIAELMGLNSRGNAKHHTTQAEKKLLEIIDDRYRKEIDDYYEGRGSSGDDL